MVSKVERTISGRLLTLESGKLAKQADGAVLVTYGESVVLVTAVAEVLRKDLGFFPLTVEYKEKQYAAGKIPGGVIKREGRPTTKEVVTMRLNDRPIRPLFPDDYGEEVQIVATVLSADRENDPDILSMIGSSAALSISDIPFRGPIAACRVGLVDDEFVVNPTHEQRERSELEIVVSGSAQAVVMVEGSANVLPEEDVLTAIELAQDTNVEVVGMIRELVEKCGRPTRAYTPEPSLEAIVKLIEPQVGERVAQAHRIAHKLERQDAFDTLRQEAIDQLCNEADRNAPSEQRVRSAFELLERKAVRSQIIGEGARHDGRGPDDVRDIQCEVAVLPRTHGSALFTRGETQALVITTLGTVRDEQRVLDPLVDEEPKKFMVHYNFPPFCVGEVRPIRSPSRREIGHGELAERAMRAVLPKSDEFPFTIRIVSDILESNGSSSMATVCGGTLSMMDAGIAISDPVAGLAMGLITENGKNVVLTDISGTEDHFGDMDFKLAGTQHGLTAMQLDLKVGGVTTEIMQEVMSKGREARIKILRHMLQTLKAPRPEVSPYAPRLQRIKIDTEKIGLVIGPGGKTIRKLEADFDCNIEVEDDGTVTISSDKQGDVAGAVRYLETFTGAGLDVGKIYEGTVTEVKDFGAIVQLFPGMDGLCHVSQLDVDYVKNVQDVCKVGDQMRVKVLSIEGNRVKLSRKAALQEDKEAQ